MGRLTRTPPQADSLETYAVGIKRQYTEAFCMRKDVYDAILKLVAGDNSEAKLLGDRMVENNQNDLCLTIKNYSINEGLSSHIHGSIG